MGSEARWRVSWYDNEHENRTALLLEWVVADSYIHPEVKALKSLVRNIIAPNRDLGHTDRALKKEQEKKDEEKAQGEQKKECEDCV